MPSYVLDTSALRGAPRKALEMAAEKKLDVSVTPMSIWELLCHLEEDAKKEGGFDRAKGPLLRALKFRMLDDPFAAHAVAVGAASTTNPTRFEDRVVTGKVLDLLATAPTLETFYSETVALPTGERGEVRNCSARAATVLAQHEAQHVKRTQKMCKKLLKKRSRKQILAPTALDFVHRTMDEADALIQSYQAAGIASEGLAERVFSCTYPHVGYLSERVRRYAIQVPVADVAKLTGNDEQDAAIVLPIVIDGNDMEDAAILLHLDLTADRALVTNDKGTLEALQVSLDRLHEVAKLQKMDLVALSRAITPAQFASEVEQAPSSLG